MRLLCAILIIALPSGSVVADICETVSQWCQDGYSSGCFTSNGVQTCGDPCGDLPGKLGCSGGEVGGSGGEVGGSGGEVGGSGGGTNCVADLAKLRKEALDATNAYRAKHGAPPLTESAQLTEVAQNYADHLASTNTWEHSDGPYGENLFQSSGVGLTGKAPIDSWYGEVSQFDFQNGEFGLNTGHFTQLVWIGSKEVGHGFGTVDCKKVYVVANYNPPGNYRGQFRVNVHPAQ